MNQRERIIDYIRKNGIAKLKVVVMEMENSEIPTKEFDVSDYDDGELPF